MTATRTRLNAPHWFRKQVEESIAKRSNKHVSLTSMTEIAEDLWEFVRSDVRMK